MTESVELVSAAEAAALRDAISGAVLTVPDGMGMALEDDPRAYLRLVAATRVAAEETSRLLRVAVDGARHAGHSWETVGGLLGVSRQAAQQRFGAPAQPLDGARPTDGARPNGNARPNDAGTPARLPARKVLTPLTAFDEMAVLADEGLRGWHSVDYGTLFHVVEASEWQWEHRRVLGSLGSRRRRLLAEGWEPVKADWFPWAYYAHQTDQPADPDRP